MAEQPDGEVPPLRPVGVDRYNRLQATNSCHWVYCSNDKFEQAHELIGPLTEVYLSLRANGVKTYLSINMEADPKTAKKPVQQA